MAPETPRGSAEVVSSVGPVLGPTGTTAGGPKGVRKADSNTKRPTRGTETDVDRWGDCGESPTQEQHLPTPDGHPGSAHWILAVPCREQAGDRDCWRDFVRSACLRSAISLLLSLTTPVMMTTRSASRHHFSIMPSQGHASKVPTRLGTR